ncbi:biotin-dependent carboxyltransferase family protein [Chengkuizengella axinellae]|uniref:Biotin-dependent carboxyltransferase family protein n=1 Tax=Chengkuizengella axinellae TaxID=3064388 RepID=A0ABT9J561_9BACL|nr:biotin-dependent carboxyltransferase family protein [Chengkuizengella sp. 2205SS18-9]MDP5276613.1 biotin-dependent carboxyltransferase family protein [Chengkuizengella sp. 2205SS18-9]
MSLKILKQGLLTTVQDLGRYGFQKYGVVASGVMDHFAARVANLLVHNEENAAVMEMTMIGPSLQFQEDVLISICGGDLSASIDGVVVPLWRSMMVRSGSVLRFGSAKSGCRAYLAVAGGISVEKVMGSSSTYLRASIGGFQGRALKQGDVISVNQVDPTWQQKANFLMQRNPSKSFIPFSWYISEHSLPVYRSNVMIRIMRGREFEYFQEESKDHLLNDTFTIHPQSDRMAYRITGPQIKLKSQLNMISEAVTMGTIQVPPDGSPRILLADRQTTGGYPRIAQVVSIDLPLIAQLKPGDTIMFQEISLEEAEMLYMQLEKDLSVLKKIIQERWIRGH